MQVCWEIKISFPQLVKYLLAEYPQFEKNDPPPFLAMPVAYSDWDYTNTKEYTKKWKKSSSLIAHQKHPSDYITNFSLRQYVSENLFVFVLSINVIKSLVDMIFFSVI